ncbi:MAG: arginine deiminase-related protein [Planctomycetota bacterium]
MSPTALVRHVPSTFARALARHPQPEGIQVDRARRQHREYRRALTALGVTVHELPADERYPDCPFIEDTAIVMGEQALITCSGAESRRGEEQQVHATLSSSKKITRMEAPLTLDGGDVLRVADVLYVGITERTDIQAIPLLEKTFQVKVVPVQVREALHLKSFCSAPLPAIVVVAEGFLDPPPFPKSVEVLVIPREEAPAANLVGSGESVIVHEGYPQTRRLLEERGIRCIPVDVSEFGKADGSLTCLSLFV